MALLFLLLSVIDPVSLCISQIGNHRCRKLVAFYWKTHRICNIVFCGIYLLKNFKQGNRLLVKANAGTDEMHLLNPVIWLL